VARGAHGCPPAHPGERDPDLGRPGRRDERRDPEWSHRRAGRPTPAESTTARSSWQVPWHTRQPSSWFTDACSPWPSGVGASLGAKVFKEVLDGELFGSVRTARVLRWTTGSAPPPCAPVVRSASAPSRVTRARRRHPAAHPYCLGQESEILRARDDRYPTGPASGSVRKSGLTLRVDSILGACQRHRAHPWHQGVDCQLEQRPQVLHLDQKR
jgi:hypothetical protein